jgi:penicillin amidase
MRTVLKRHRFLKGAALAFAFMVLAALIGILWLCLAMRPSYTGHVRLPDLSASVRVYRDEHGVPHIFAGNMKDAMRALGYVHASERLFQMEMQRRAGQGRLAEAIGPSMAGTDKFIRTLDLYRLAQSSITALSPDAQDVLEAYAGGVNAWIDQHRHSLPPEFLLLDLKPEPWLPADSLVWGKLMALQLSHNYKLEILRAQLAKKLTPAQMLGLFPPYGDDPVTTEPRTKRGIINQKSENPSLSKWVASSAVTNDVLERLGYITSLDHAASNEWVVAGARTESGKPILANDPHLGLDAPILWYLARIVTPKLTIKGATVPGLPVILLGQNDAIAWGMTTTGSDVEDLFIETVDPKNSHRYLTPEGSKAFEERVETIHVKNLNDIILHVRATRHGPVLSDIDPSMAALAGRGKVMALAFTGLGAHDTTAEALMRMNTALSWRDFIKALQLYQAPPQNIVFADTKGDIGFINPGLVPVRKSGDGLMPAEGTSGAHDWDGTIPFDRVPQLYNPPAGFIFNANNAVTAPDPSRWLGIDWEESYRAERLQQFFDSDTKHTLDTDAAMQADHLSLAARQLLPYLLRQKPAAPRAREALDMLRNWDGVMDKNRPEPLIFEAWLYKMHKDFLIDKTGSPLKEKGPFAASSIAFALGHDGSGYCKDKTCDEIIMQAFGEALALLTERDGTDMKRWRWGHEHITQLKNKFFRHVPVLGGLTDLSIASSGDFYTLDRGGSFDPQPSHPFARTHGGGYRGLYDLADPEKSRFMITTGESGSIFSKHYGDLVPLWNDVKSFTLTGTAEEFSAHGLPKLVFKP